MTENGSTKTLNFGFWGLTFLSGEELTLSDTAFPINDVGYVTKKGPGESRMYIRCQIHIGITNTFSLVGPAKNRWRRKAPSVHWKNIEIYAPSSVQICKLHPKTQKKEEKKDILYLTRKAAPSIPLPVKGNEVRNVFAREVVEIDVILIDCVSIAIHVILRYSGLTGCLVVHRLSNIMYHSCVPLNILTILLICDFITVDVVPGNHLSEALKIMYKTIMNDRNEVLQLAPKYLSTASSQELVVKVLSEFLNPPSLPDIYNMLFTELNMPDLPVFVNALYCFIYVNYV
ncbi:unnamed protein product [Meganyctiphanes norvegica]|uniref:Uncharacterized protein n=1 Tax=Meganyctiphanes norvegica TaxID=48144 RepID=A0AAV2RIR4_MEGNR